MFEQQMPFLLFLLLFINSISELFQESFPRFDLLVLTFKTNTGLLVRLVFLNQKIKEKCNVFFKGNGGGSLTNLMFCFFALHNLPCPIQELL